jgi:integrase
MDKKFPAGIRPRGNGLQIRIWQNGKEVHEEIIKANPDKDADVKRVKKYRDELQVKFRLGLAFDDEDNPSHLQSFANMAQEYLKTGEWKYSTKLSYLSILNTHWMPLFGKKPCASITTRQIKNFLADLKNPDTGKPLTRKTKDNILGPLRGVLDHAEVQNNPAAVIKTKNSQKKPIERYRPVEREKLLSCLSGDVYVYFALLFGCGFRPGEIMGLLRNDFDGQEWHVHQQIVRGLRVESTKTGHRRKVYIPLWVRQVMKSMPARIDSPYFFVNEDGGFFKDTRRFNRAWKKAHDKKQIRYRIPYCCRHTRAAELLSKGTLPGKCAQQLGHSLAVFYNTYAEMIDEYQIDRDLEQFEPLPETEHKPHR